MDKEKEKGKGKKLSKREMVDRFQENCDRIGEITDLCEKEERERTEAEEAEIQAIIREKRDYPHEDAGDAGGESARPRDSGSEQ